MYINLYYVLYLAKSGPVKTGPAPTPLYYNCNNKNESKYNLWMIKKVTETSKPKKFWQKNSSVEMTLAKVKDDSLQK